MQGGAENPDKLSYQWCSRIMRVFEGKGGWTGTDLMQTKAESRKDAVNDWRKLKIEGWILFKTLMTTIPNPKSNNETTPLRYTENLWKEERDIWSQSIFLLYFLSRVKSSGSLQSIAGLSIYPHHYDSISLLIEY